MNETIEDHRDENGALHRVDGPALVCPDGDRFWYCHGKFRRRGGPALAYSDRRGLWYINDRFLRAPDRLPKAAHPIMELFL